MTLFSILESLLGLICGTIFLLLSLMAVEANDRATYALEQEDIKRRKMTRLQEVKAKALTAPSVEIAKVEPERKAYSWMEAI